MNHKELNKTITTFEKTGTPKHVLAYDPDITATLRNNEIALDARDAKTRQSRKYAGQLKEASEMLKLLRMVFTRLYAMYKNYPYDHIVAVYESILACISTACANVGYPELLKLATYVTCQGKLACETRDHVARAILLKQQMAADYKEAQFGLMLIALGHDGWYATDGRFVTDDGHTAAADEGLFINAFHGKNVIHLVSTVGSAHDAGRRRIGGMTVTESFAEFWAPFRDELMAQLKLQLAGACYIPSLGDVVNSDVLTVRANALKALDEHNEAVRAPAEKAARNRALAALAPYAQLVSTLINKYNEAAEAYGKASSIDAFKKAVQKEITRDRERPANVNDDMFVINIDMDETSIVTGIRIDSRCGQKWDNVGTIRITAAGEVSWDIGSSYDHAKAMSKINILIDEVPLLVNDLKSTDVYL